jgi:phosphoribosylanthranilate isomerase
MNATMPALVKICGLKSFETIDAAIDAGADMLGFVFFSASPRNVHYTDARNLAKHVGDRALKVALTVDAEDGEIAAIVEALEPDLLQLHGEEEPRRVAEIRSRYRIPVMKVIGVSTPADVARAEAYRFVGDRILFDAKPPKDARLPGGNGSTFDWAILKGVDLGKPWMLSGGLTPANVAQALRTTGAPGVDVSSGVERAPGDKDPGRIAAFVKAAKAADPPPAPESSGRPELPGHAPRS